MLNASTSVFRFNFLSCSFLIVYIQFNGAHKVTDWTSNECRYTATDNQETKFAFDKTRSCPPYLKELLAGGTLYCYTVTDKQQYPPKCPYPLTMSFGNLVKLNLYQKFEREYLWLPLTRNLTDGYGPFEWIGPDENYGEFPKLTPLNSNKNKTCAIINQSSYIAVSCNDYYKALCIYPDIYKDLSFDCQTKHNNAYCISNSLNTENYKCFCKQTSLKSCKQAEPQTKYESELLENELNYDKGTCWFGLRKNDVNDYRWLSTNCQANYSFWVINTNYSNTKPAFQFCSYKGWTLVENKTKLNCQLCQYEQIIQNVKIEIKYNRHVSELQVDITNFNQISSYFRTFWLVFCFYGPLDSKLKERLYNIDNDYRISNIDKQTIRIPLSNYLSPPTYHWCEVFHKPNLMHTYSNTILIYPNADIFEYSLHITAKTAGDPYEQDSIYKICICLKSFLFEEDVLHSRPMKVLHFDEQNLLVNFIIHITTPVIKSEYESYIDLRDTLYSLDLNYCGIYAIHRFGRSEFCLNDTTTFGDFTLTWPKTTTGTYALSNEICVLENGLPLRRLCEGNFLIGAVWENVEKICSQPEELSEHTLELYNLLNNENVTSSELSKTLSDITNSSKESAAVIDVYFISKNLEKLSAFEEIDIKDVASIISNTMNYDPNVLTESQAFLNSTDEILDNLNKIINKIQLDKEYEVITSEKLLIQTNNLRTTDVIGLVLEKIDNVDTNFGHYQIFPVLKNTSLSSLTGKDIELAVILPEDLRNEITTCVSSNVSLVLVIQLFYDDALFNENSTNEHKVDSKIVSIDILNLNCSFKTPIPIFFKAFHNPTFAKGCAFWNYGIDGAQENYIQGRWSKDGNLNYTTNGIVVCQFEHITHFALLMMGKINDKDQEQNNDLVLDLITGIGCVLSLISIFVMFVIAIVSEKWRRSSSNQILLNFSGAIALQLISLYIAASIRIDGLFCNIFAAYFHYTLLAEFSWMLVISLIQYRKFVLVFYRHISHLVRKSCTLCWGLPIIPVTMFVAFSNKGYHKNAVGLCYPSGLNFYVGIIFPISVIICVNVFIFVKIFIAIRNSKTKAYGNQKKTKLHLLLAVCLFFLMGLSWIFGLGVTFIGNLIFSYLFCLTASFQGFFMFMFFIILNERTRILWGNVKNYFRSRKVRRESDLSASLDIDLIYK